MENLLHLVQLVLGDRGALAGRDHAQDVAAQGREGDETADIDPESLLVKAVHVFREGLPVPAHSLAHGLQRDGLDAVHHTHIEVAVFRAGWGKPEAALADGQGGHAELARQGGVGVPVELRIVVGMQVHRAGGDDAPAGVQFLGSAPIDAPADHRHPAILDGKVGADAWDAGAVNHGAAANYEVVFWHSFASIYEFRFRHHKVQVQRSLDPAYRRVKLRRKFGSVSVWLEITHENCPNLDTTEL